MNDPVNDPCINGPKLAAWLRERDRLPLSLDSEKRRGGPPDPIAHLLRRVKYWEKGEQAEVVTVDKWFCELGLCLTELPDDFWEDRNGRPRKSRPNPTKQRALQLLNDGLGITEVARGLKVSRRAIGRWRDEAAA